MPMLSMYAPHMNREEFASELKRIASMLREGYTSGQKANMKNFDPNDDLVKERRGAIVETIKAINKGLFNLTVVFSDQ